MWDHKLGFVFDFKPKFSLKKPRKMQTDKKKWLHIILRKWDSNSKNSKWIFKRKEFLKGVFGEKGFDFKIKGINF